jgi:putative Ca2+/H+ antiporter (TMEM165/GDT1 family)
MVGWFDILISAFVLQLLALPGEKGQMVIAALATKYSPYMVVAGAATAFGGWTVLEILLGNALKGALPEVFLDGLTAALFFIFAAWVLYTSQLDFADEPSEEQMRAAGSSRGVDDAVEVVPSRFAGFVPSFSLMVFGEFGDKTQLITIGLAVQYGAHPAIWLGEMLAIVPVSLATALFFSRSSAYINTKWVRYVSASLFGLFGLDIMAKYLLGVHVLPF